MRYHVHDPRTGVRRRLLCVRTRLGGLRRAVHLRVFGPHQLWRVWRPVHRVGADVRRRPVRVPWRGLDLQRRLRR